MTAPNLVPGVAFMDEDHANIESLCERAKETADARLPALLAEIEAELRAHFEREEALMQSAGVPVFHCHAAQHKLLMAEFTRGHYSAGTGDMDGLRRFLSHSLPALAAAHADSVDRVTASFLKGEIDEQELSNLRLPQG